MSKPPASKTFSVGGLNGKSVLTLVLLVMAIAVSFYAGRTNVPIPAMICLAAVVFAFTAWLLSSAKVTLTDEFLIAGGGIYKVRIPWSQVVFDDIEVMQASSPFKLRWRTNGLGWPGLSLGWFTTNGSRRVFAAINGKKNRVYIPLQEKFDLVITPTEVGAFMTELGARRFAGNFSQTSAAAP